MRFASLVPLCGLAFVGFVSCVSSSRPEISYVQDQFGDYTIVDAVDKDVVSVKLSSGSKIAVIVRDVSTTSYSFLEPRYSNSIVNYEGLSFCCRHEHLVGQSGFAIYRFAFVGKGITSIRFIARQKGMNATAGHLDSDQETVVTAQVD